MKKQTLNLLEDVISTAGEWISLEISSDSLYLEFSNTQLYNDDYPNSTELTLRFGKNIMLNIYYNNLEDIEPLVENNVLTFSFKEFSFKLKNEEFKFQDINYLNDMKELYKFCLNLNNNKYCDFILVFNLENFGILVGGDILSVFNDFEYLNEFDIKNLSNKWCRDYLRDQTFSLKKC